MITIHGKLITNTKKGHLSIRKYDTGVIVTQDSKTGQTEIFVKDKFMYKHNSTDNISQILFGKENKSGSVKDPLLTFAGSDITVFLDHRVSLEPINDILQIDPGSWITNMTRDDEIKEIKRKLKGGHPRRFLKGEYTMKHILKIVSSPDYRFFALLTEGKYEDLLYDAFRGIVSVENISTLHRRVGQFSPYEPSRPLSKSDKLPSEDPYVRPRVESPRPENFTSPEWFRALEHYTGVARPSLLETHSGIVTPEAKKPTRGIRLDQDIPKNVPIHSTLQDKSKSAFEEYTSPKLPEEFDLKDMLLK